MTHPPPGAARPPAADAQTDARALRESAGLLVRLAQLRSFEEFSRRLEDLGITPACYSVLATVAANPGVRPGAVADGLRIAPPNVASPVNQPVSDGLVRHRSDAAEPRANRLHPTARGAGAFAEMQRRVAQADAALLQHLARAERARFVRVLRRLLRRRTVPHRGACLCGPRVIARAHK